MMVFADRGSIRKITEADLPMVLAWRNSDRIRLNMYNEHIITFDEHKSWFLRLQASSAQECLIFSYEGQPVGVVTFNDLDNVNKTAFWGFYLGRTDTIRGTGTLLGFSGLEYAFTVLGLRKVCGEALAFNTGSIGFHTRLGFVEEGRFREQLLQQGKYQDIIRYGLLAAEWQVRRDKIKIKLSGEG